MVEKDYELSDASWIRRHAKELGAAGLGAAAVLATMTTLYEVRKHRRRIAEQYAEKADIFELAAEEPTKRAVTFRSITAHTLTHLGGMTQKQLQASVAPGIFKAHIGDELHALVQAHVVAVSERPSDKVRLFQPHDGFLIAIAEHPDLWQPVINLAEQYDPAFSIEQFRSPETES